MKPDTQNPQAREAIDALIAAFFSAFDNRNGPLALDGILSCFADKAVIARSLGEHTELYTPLEFAAPRIALLTQGALVDFHEAETEAVTDCFGAIATRISRYRKSGVLDGKPYAGSGTKCFHLVAIDGGWRIAALAWADDGL